MVPARNPPNIFPPDAVAANQLHVDGLRNKLDRLVDPLRVTLYPGHSGTDTFGVTLPING